MGCRTFTLVNFEPLVVVCLNDARAANQHNFISDRKYLKMGKYDFSIVFHCTLRSLYLLNGHQYLNKISYSVFIKSFTSYFEIDRSFHQSFPPNFVKLVV